MIMHRILFIQLLMGYPPFRGNEENEQLEKIIEILGSIDEEDWPEVKYLKRYNTILYKNKSVCKLAELLKR